MSKQDATKKSGVDEFVKDATIQGFHVGVESMQDWVSSKGLGKIETTLVNSTLGIASHGMTFAGSYHDAQQSGDQNPGRTAALTTAATCVMPGPSTLTSVGMSVMEASGAHLEQKIEESKQNPQLNRISAADGDDSRAEAEAFAKLLQPYRLIADVLAWSGEKIDQHNNQYNQNPKIQRLRAHDPEFNEDQALIDGVGPASRTGASIVRDGLVPSAVKGINWLLDPPGYEPTTTSQTPFSPTIPESLRQTLAPARTVPPHVNPPIDPPPFNPISITSPEEKIPVPSVALSYTTPKSRVDLTSPPPPPPPPPLLPPQNPLSSSGISIGGKITGNRSEISVSVPIPEPVAIVVAVAALANEGVKEISKHLKKRRDRDYGRRFEETKSQVTVTPVDIPSTLLTDVPTEIKAAVSAKLQEEMKWCDRELDRRTNVEMRKKNIENCDDRLGNRVLFFTHKQDKASRAKSYREKEQYLKEAEEANAKRVEAIESAKQILRTYEERQAALQPKQEQAVVTHPTMCSSGGGGGEVFRLPPGERIVPLPEGSINQCSLSLFHRPAELYGSSVREVRSLANSFNAGSASTMTGSFYVPPAPPICSTMTGSSYTPTLFVERIGFKRKFSQDGAVSSLKPDKLLKTITRGMG